MPLAPRPVHPRPGHLLLLTALVACGTDSSDKDSGSDATGGTTGAASWGTQPVRAAAVITGPGDQDRFGAELAAMDFTGGGLRVAVVVGAGGEDDPAAHAGALYVFAQDLRGTLDHTDATARITGAFEGDGVGNLLVTAGDVTGDGIGDLWVGRGGDRGPLVLVSGPLSGQATIDDVADAELSFGAPLHQTLLTPAGDLDADGQADLLAVGVNRSYTSVWLVSGASAASGDVSSLGQQLDPTGRRQSIYSVAAEGTDWTGDGMADVAVGLPEDSSAASGGGTAAVLPGPIHAETGAGDVAATLLGAGGDGAGARLIAAGDLNGDGHADLAVGGSHDERLWLVLGPLSGTTALADAPSFIAEGATSLEVVPAGDPDGDGVDALLLSPRHADSFYDELSEGEVLLVDLRDFEAGSYAAAPLLFTGGRCQFAGAEMMSPGDASGDGRPDAVIGAPGYCYSDDAYPGVSWPGAVYLPHGFR